MKKISVLVPVYNVEQYIERCVKSLFSQTFTDGVEYIFVDDASTDSSLDILKGQIAQHPEVDARIIRHDHNRGLAAARHTAIEAAQGDYITHVDSDDFVTVDFLEQLYHVAIENGADLVVGNVTIVGLNEVTETDQHIDSEDAGIDILLDNISCDIHAKLISRSIYTSHPNVICPDEISNGEDLYSTIRIGHYAEKVAVCKKPTYFYLANNPTSVSHIRFNRRFESFALCLPAILEFFDNEFPDGRYRETVRRAVTQLKSVQIIHFADFNLRRRYAELLREETAPYICELRGSYRIMMTLVHHRIWPLVWLFGKLISLREVQARKHIKTNQ